MVIRGARYTSVLGTRRGVNRVHFNPWHTGHAGGAGYEHTRLGQARSRQDWASPGENISLAHEGSVPVWKRITSCPICGTIHGRGPREIRWHRSPLHHPKPRWVAFWCGPVYPQGRVDVARLGVRRAPGADFLPGYASGGMACRPILSDVALSRHTRQNFS